MIENRILDALPASLAVLDGTGVITYVNRAWQRFAEENGMKDPGCGVGQSYLSECERSSSDEARLLVEGIRQVLRGSSERFELDYPCHAPNQERWFMALVTPFLSDSGRGALVTHVDVTVYHLAQDHLIELSRTQSQVAITLGLLRARLQEAQAAARMGSWEADLRASTVTCTDEIYRIFAGGGEDFHPDYPGILEWVHPDDRDRVRQACLESLQGGSFSIQHRLVLPDGKVKLLEHHWQVVRGQGSPVRALGSCRELSEMTG